MDRQNQPTSPQSGEHAKHEEKNKGGTLGRLVVPIVVFIIILAAALAVTKCTSVGGSGNSVSGQTLDRSASGGVGGNIEDTESDMYASYTPDSRTIGKNDISSDYAILIDLENNTVLASKKGDEKMYPASMTKMMTLIVAAEHAENLDDTFEMTTAITDPLFLENASVAGFLNGEQVTLRDLMYGLILPSGADCAVALALYTAGSEAAFADMMNEKVAELGLKNTHFMNPTGLHDENQYSTCHEIALILEYALRDDFMRTVLSTYKYTTEKTPQHPGGITLYSTMQSRMYGNEAPGMFVLGGKTGYTTEAGNCLASYAVKYDKDTEKEDDLKSKTPGYIFVSAHGGSVWAPIFDAINMYATVVDPNALETKQVSAR